MSFERKRAAVNMRRAVTTQRHQSKYVKAWAKELPEINNALRRHRSPRHTCFLPSLPALLLYLFPPPSLPIRYFPSLALTLPHAICSKKARPRQAWDVHDRDRARTQYQKAGKRSVCGRASAIAHRIIQVDARSRSASVKIGAIAQGLAPSCFNLGATAPCKRALSRQD